MNIKQIIDYLKEARETNHNNRADNEYATYNALDRLLINVKNIKIKKPQDVVDIVQKSSQEGLIMNLKEIFKNNEFINLREAIQDDNIGVDMMLHIKNTVVKLKL